MVCSFGLTSVLQIQQIKIAHDSEERALNSKSAVENERDIFKQKVASLEADRIARRTKVALERQELLKEVSQQSRKPTEWL